MSYTTLKDRIQQITEIASAVPEEFRQKCFELLMINLLGGTTSPVSAPVATLANPALPLPMPTALGFTGQAPMTALLSAFVKKAGLTPEQFAQVVGYRHGQITFFREPRIVRAYQGQIEWSLLLALKNAILKGAFLVDAEEVRLACQEKGFHDRRSFYTNFRRSAEYFRAPPEPGGRAQPLSIKGLTALGALVAQLASSD